MAREVTEAHYLHERKGLEPVLRPPVDQPTVLAWIPGREELLVGTRDGDLVHVDPVLGTRTLCEDGGEIAALRVSPDRKRYLAITRQGTWRVATLRGEVEASGEHEFLTGMAGFFAGAYVVVVGNTPDGRYLRVMQGSKVVTRARLPAGVVAMLDAQGRPLLARSTPAGLSVIRFGKKSRFPTDESTVHRLKATGSAILGFTSSGVCVWEQSGGAPRSSTRLPDLTAGDITADGRYLGLGTRSGAVALSRMDKKDQRMRPDLIRAFNAPVTAVEFSTRGRWLATAAESLRLWTWED